MKSPEIDMDLQEFRGILAEALSEGGTQPLLRLTDEEIAILDPDSLTECVAPTPRISALSGQEREWVYATALRSLVSREAVEVANIDELDAVLRAADASLPVRRRGIRRGHGPRFRPFGRGPRPAHHPRGEPRPDPAANCRPRTGC